MVASSSGSITQPSAMNWRITATMSRVGGALDRCHPLTLVSAPLRANPYQREHP